MRIVVVGAGGRVGTALTEAAADVPGGVVSLARDRLDVTDAAAVRSRLAELPDSVVVNAAAFTAVDRAETEPEAAFAVNRDGAAHVAEACAALDLSLIHLSTDYVFDGRSPRPYLEDDPVAPLSAYGAGKAEGEEAVRRLCPRHAVLRLSWLYGGAGGSFVRSIIHAAAHGRPLRVVSDQVGAPTHVDDVAAAILALASRLGADQLPFGTYHFTAAGAASWYEVAARILGLMTEWGRPKVPLEAVTAADYGLPARRPANSLLDCGRYDRVVGMRRPPWDEPLPSEVRRILSEGSAGA